MHTSISFIFFYLYAVVIHLDLDAKSISWFLYHIKIIQINVIPIFIDSWSLTLAKLNSLIKMPSLNMYAVISWPSPKLWFYRLYGCCNQLSIATVLLNAHEWMLNRYQSRSPRTLYMYRWSVDSMLMLTVISHNVHVLMYIFARNILIREIFVPQRPCTAEFFSWFFYLLLYSYGLGVILRWKESVNTVISFCLEANSCVWSTKLIIFIVFRPFSAKQGLTAPDIEYRREQLHKPCN